jgi:predicted ArsR family transcriptional regulator
MKGLLQNILEYLEASGPQGPGDVVAALGAPRYRVLAAFHCLEELGLVSPLYSKGTYKIYRITGQGRLLLRIAQEQGDLSIALQSILEAGISDRKGGENAITEA